MDVLAVASRVLVAYASTQKSTTKTPFMAALIGFKYE